MLKQLNLTLTDGQRLLIQGPSGIGKTTLLRTIAGLWLDSDGKIYCPQQTLFLSQKSYLPQGSLRATLYYPKPYPTTESTNAVDVLKSVH